MIDSYPSSSKQNYTINSIEIGLCPFTNLNLLKKTFCVRIKFKNIKGSPRNASSKMKRQNKRP